MISIQDLTQHVRTLLNKEPDTRVIGFQDPGNAADDFAEGVEEEVGLGHKRYRAVYAISELAMRAELVDFEHSSEVDVLVLITPLETADIGLDIRYRLLKNRLKRFDPWEAIRTIFDARDIDPALRQYKGFGKALLRSSGTINYAHITTSTLTEEEAWTRFLQQEYNFEGELGDSSAWLEWALRQPARLKILFEDELLSSDLLNFVDKKLGSSGRFIVKSLSEGDEQSHPARGVLLGALAIRALEAAKQTTVHKELAIEIRGALPGALGWQGGPKSVLQELELVAGEVTRLYEFIERKDPALVSWVGAELDTLFKSLEAEELSIYSNISSLGWDALLEGFADALMGDDQATILESVRRLEQHDAFVSNKHIKTHVNHLKRLWYYSKNYPHNERADLGTLMRDYITHGSFEDWCREQLTTSDLGPILHKPAQKLLDGLHDKRDMLSGLFAQQAASYLNENKKTSLPNSLPIRHVVDRVVAPLAQNRPVLMLVLDGLSWGVLRRLLDELEHEKEWTPWIPCGLDHQILPMCSAIPSVTALSRHMLLTGKLDKGNQQKEKIGFSTHPALVGLKGAKKWSAPVVFHKGELDSNGPGGVGTDVFNAIMDTDKQRVVSIVINTIDDQLAGAEQMNIQWSLDSILPLRSLLNLAISSKRLVILTSDHGHVWEDRSQVPAGVHGTHGRYRVDGGAVTSKEVALRGAVSRTLVGQEEVIVPFGERIRYSNPHRGYHGGISLQEVVTPLVVLSQDSTLEEEQDELRLMQFITSPPGWWDFKAEEAEFDWPEQGTIFHKEEQVKEEVKQDKKVEVPAKPKEAPQLSLLSPAMTKPEHVQEVNSNSLEETSAVKEKRAIPQDTRHLVEKLLNTELYIHQANMNRSIGSAHESVFRVLVMLIEQDGKASEKEISRAIEKAGSRTRRLLSAMQNVLNIDGYEVLSYDRQQGTLHLNYELLMTQFELHD